LRQAPKHLKKAGREFWQKTLKQYAFEDEHSFQRLADACMTRDTVAACVKKIEAEGVTYLDRFDKPKQNVCIKIMHDAQGLFLRIVRELGLDLSDEESRPPRQYQ